MTKTINKIVAFACIFLVACSNNNFEDQIGVIESKQAKIDSLKEVVKSLHYDSLDYMVNTCRENIAEAKKYYTLDSVDQKFAQQITMYKGVKKNVPNVPHLKMVLSNNLDTLEQQFSDLHTDTKNAVHGKKKLNKYIQNETENLEVVITDINKFQKTYKSVADVFYKYNGVIEEYIVKLKNLNDSTAVEK